MVYATLISSGLNRWPTHEGLFQVWEHWYEYKMGVFAKPLKRYILPVALE
jgi:hypothetical protein